MLWRKRYQDEGLAGILEDRPRSGRPKEISAEHEAAIVETTLHGTPRDATHWSVRSMAKSQGVSPASVQRIWKRHHLQPHRVEKFKFSTDPQFVAKVPLRPGLPERQTHDYERHGTTTLFARSTWPQARSSPNANRGIEEFLRFLQQIDAATHQELEVHLILDNYGTHKHPQVQNWFRAHPRYHLHFAPTSAS